MVLVESSPQTNRGPAEFGQPGLISVPALLSLVDLALAGALPGPLPQQRLSGPSSYQGLRGPCAPRVHSAPPFRAAGDARPMAHARSKPLPAASASSTSGYLWTCTSNRSMAQRPATAISNRHRLSAQPMQSFSQQSVEQQRRRQGSDELASQMRADVSYGRAFSPSQRAPVQRALFSPLSMPMLRGVGHSRPPESVLTLLNRDPPPVVGARRSRQHKREPHVVELEGALVVGAHSSQLARAAQERDARCDAPLRLHVVPWSPVERERQSGLARRAPVDACRVRASERGEVGR